SYDSASLASGDHIWVANSTIIGPPAEANNSASIFFIMTNNVNNVVPTSDPIFGVDPGGSPVRVISCIEEHELCNPNLPSLNDCRKFVPTDDVFALIES